MQKVGGISKTNSGKVYIMQKFDGKLQIPPKKKCEKYLIYRKL